MPLQHSDETPPPRLLGQNSVRRLNGQCDEFQVVADAAVPAPATTVAAGDERTEFRESQE